MAYSVPKCSNRKIFLNNKYYLEYCGVHAWLGSRACYNYLCFTTIAVKNVLVLSKRILSDSLFLQNGTSLKKESDVNLKQLVG